MSFLKKLLKRKEKSNISDQKADDLNLKKLIEKFEFYNENQIKNIIKTHKGLKKNPSKESEIVKAVIEDGIEYRIAKKYQEIVNDYGNAITKASELNKRKVEEFGNCDSIKRAKAIQDKKSIFYILQGKFDNRLLPYDKNTIKEAIEFLIEYETDENYIEDLQRGLLYLNDFIDFSQYDS